MRGRAREAQQNEESNHPDVRHNGAVARGWRKRVVILNYDRLGKLFEVTPEARTKICSKKGLARAGSAAD